MSNILLDSSNLTNIANAIRDKNGTQTHYKPREMAAAIEAIESYKPEETFNVTPSTTQQTITPSSGHVFSSGVVQAMPVGSATTPATTQQQSQPTFTQSGDTITATVLATSVNVTPTVVPGYVASGTAGTITMSANSNTYTIPAGTQGTPTTTKTISGNTATITPSATDITGYIDGTTKTGSPVTVTASELVSGSITTTPKVTSQTIDVTNYASSTVSPIYEEISTPAGMDATKVAANEGKMYKYTGTTSGGYTNGRLYIVEEVI